MASPPDGERLAALEARINLLERDHAGVVGLIRDLDDRVRDLTDRIWRLSVLLAGAGAVGSAAGSAFVQALAGG